MKQNDSIEDETPSEGKKTESEWQLKLKALYDIDKSQKMNRSASSEMISQQKINTVSNIIKHINNPTAKDYYYASVIVFNHSFNAVDYEMAYTYAIDAYNTSHFKSIKLKDHHIKIYNQLQLAIQEPPLDEKQRLDMNTQTLINPVDKIYQVENGLIESKVHAGNAKKHSLLERMKIHHVHGVSMTIINDEETWSKDYGEVNCSSHTQRLFQAGSISKPITAVIALILVQKGLLNLDTDINEFLKSWKIPKSDYTASEKITLRHLLSHTAGLSVHGFTGYPHSALEKMPSNIQILEGSCQFIAIPTLQGMDLTQFCAVYLFSVDTSMLHYIDERGQAKMVRSDHISEFITTLKANKSIELPYQQTKALLDDGDKYSQYDGPVAHNAHVESKEPPGKLCIYSGGGMQVVQQMIEDVTGKSFAQVAQEEIFEPLGMKFSSFELDFPDKSACEVALGYATDESIIDGDWHIYPQSAAAGLWTTSQDLAYFLMEVQNAFHGKNSKILSQKTAINMLQLQKNSDHGLGPQINKQSKEIEFFHGGINFGYNAYFVSFPIAKKTAVIMTNSTTGMNLIREIVSSIGKVYDWPANFNFSNKIKYPITLENAAAIYQEYAGCFVLQFGKDQLIHFQLIAEDGKFFISLPFPSPQDNPMKFELIPESKISFFSAEANIEINFPEGNKNLIKSSTFGDATITELNIAEQRRYCNR